MYCSDDIFDSMIIDWAVDDEAAFLDNGFGLDAEFSSTLVDDNSLFYPSEQPNSQNPHTGEPVDSHNHQQLPYPAAASRSNQSTGSHNYLAADTDSRLANGNSQTPIDGLEHQEAVSSSHFLRSPAKGILQSSGLLLQLAQLSINLDDQARGAPSFTIHESTGKSGQPIVDEVSWDYPGTRQYSMEDTFKSTQCLLDLLPRLTDDATQRKQRDDVLDSEVYTVVRMDHSLILLIISCCHRLIDIWHSMFAHMKTSIRTYTIPSLDARHQAHCAKMTIGSYMPWKSSTTVPMEIIVLQELASQLVKRVDNLVKALHIDASSGEKCLNLTPDSAGQERQDENAAVAATTTATLVAAKALKERAVGMREEAIDIKTRLEKVITEQSPITKIW